MNPNELIGRNILRAREEMDMKQDTLAKIIGITAGALSNIETGKTDITVSRIKDIAIALKKDFYYILGHPNQVHINNSPNTWLNNQNITQTDSNLILKSISTSEKAIELLTKMMENQNR